MMKLPSLRKYQEKVLDQLKFNTTNLVSICPSGGKTLTALHFIKKHYENKKVLILTHGTNVLKTQWASELSLYDFDFSKDLNSQSNIVITLPQTLNRRLQKNKTFNNYDLIVIDEAHEFYLQPMIQNALKAIKYETLLLLTGTPSKLIAGTKNVKPLKPIVISGVEVFDEGYLTNLGMNLIQSSYKLQDTHYVKGTDEVKESFIFNKKDTENTFERLVEGMIYRLSQNKVFKANPNLKNSLTHLDLGKKALSVFKSLDKTMIATRNINQAVLLSSILKKHNIPHVMSNQKNDISSENIEKFKNDTNLKVLIVVRRGVLGFNFPELVNVVDLTMSRNIDRIYQLYARALRKHDKIQDKFFFKVGSELNIKVDEFYLSAAMCLNNEEFISSYNGKNLNERKILVKTSLVDNEKSKKTSKSCTGVKKPATKIDSELAIAFMDLKLLSEYNVNDGSEHFKDYKMVKFGEAIAKLKGVKFARYIKDIKEEDIVFVIDNGYFPESIYE